MVFEITPVPRKPYAHSPQCPSFPEYGSYRPLKERQSHLQIILVDLILGAIEGTFACLLLWPSRMRQRILRKPDRQRAIRFQISILEKLIIAFRATYDGKKCHVFYRGKIFEELKLKPTMVAFCRRYYSFLILPQKPRLLSIQVWL